MKSVEKELMRLEQLTTSTLVLVASLTVTTATLPIVHPLVLLQQDIDMVTTSEGGRIRFPSGTFLYLWKLKIKFKSTMQDHHAYVCAPEM